jgi:hypothetical protein
MKLTKENIQFIDTYLKNSNVIYVDIRLEMTDHIATAVEDKMKEENLDFYDGFKNYMVENKTTILKNNKEKISFSWTEIKKYLLFTMQPTTLIFAVLLLLLHQYVDINSYFSKEFTLNNLLFILIISICLFQIIYYFIYLKKRFYSLEKSGIVLFILYYLQIFFIPSGSEGNNILSLFFFYLIFAYLLYFFKEIKTFQKHKYNFA